MVIPSSRVRPLVADDQELQGHKNRERHDEVDICAAGEGQGNPRQRQADHDEMPDPQSLLVDEWCET